GRRALARLCYVAQRSNLAISTRQAGISFSRWNSQRIITRSPLRISVGGGGTDLPSYYREHGGFLIAAAIDKYVYINVHRRFVDGVLLKYSSLEEAHTIDEINHPGLRGDSNLGGLTTHNLYN